MAYTIALDIDAIIQKVLQYPVSFDAVILQNKIRQVLLDAVVKQEQKKYLDIDAIVFHIYTMMYPKYIFIKDTRTDNLFIQDERIIFVAYKRKK